MAVIGLDLGGTKLAAAIFTDEGAVAEKRVVPLGKRRGGEVGVLITGQAKHLLDRACTDHTRVEAVGVSVPGIYDPAAGTVWAPNVPGWEQYPLLDELAGLVGGEAPVTIDSDRTCYILGEVWQGAAQGCRDALFVAVGTGIGAGILIDGNVLRGRDGIAGAIGWMALDRPYRFAYEGCGCFEYHASGSGLANVARERLREKDRYAGPLRKMEAGKITAKDVFRAHAGGDPLAGEVIEEAVAFWGMAVANLVSLFNPEKIIFGGGVFGAAAGLLDRIEEEARRWAQPISMRQVTLEVTRLGADAGLYGAGKLGMMALESHR